MQRIIFVLNYFRNISHLIYQFYARRDIRAVVSAIIINYMEVYSWLKTDI